MNADVNVAVTGTKHYYLLSKQGIDAICRIHYKKFNKSQFILLFSSVRSKVISHRLLPFKAGDSVFPDQSFISTCGNNEPTV